MTVTGNTPYRPATDSTITNKLLVTAERVFINTLFKLKRWDREC